MEATLFYLPPSPWSQKVRCVLRHHGISPRHERAYAPLIDELGLRWRLSKWSGRVTVPVLFTPERALTDSFEIARYADERGTGTKLFPADRASELLHWNACSERLLNAGRGLAMLRMLESPAAAHEMLPPGPAKLLSPGVALLAMRAFNAKYGITATDRTQYHASARSELLRLREALAGGRRYLFGALSYADFEMASSLILLGPVPESPHGPASRKVMTDPTLASEFSDLTAWRNAFHADHPLV